MSTVKEKAKEVLEKLPEDATWEDLEYAVYVKKKIEEGLEAVRRGDLVSQEEIEKKFRERKWR